jgi:molybdopterin molybdotransferase
MTGALLPDGADSVIPVEDTDREAGATGWVKFVPRDGSARRGISRGQHVRPAGEEMAEGSVLGRPGDSVGFGLLALLAAAGERSVAVHPAPRVALLVTGDELVPAGDREALEGGVRRADILSPALPILLGQGGAGPIAPMRVPDDLDSLADALARASVDADLIITTGGASMGEADLVKRALETLGGEPVFWRIRMRPGSPVSLVRLPRRSGNGTVPVLGLPGNPASAIVTTLTLALPAIRAIGGHRSRLLRRIRATAGEAFGGPDTLARFYRVTLSPGAEGGIEARSSGPQGSGALAGLAVADGLAVVAEGTPAVEPGASVDVLLFPASGFTETP